MGIEENKEFLMKFLGKSTKIEASLYEDLFTDDFVTHTVGAPDTDKDYYINHTYTSHLH